MKISVVGNVLRVEKFKSKDGSKEFSNASIVVDNVVLDFKFVKDDCIKVLEKLPRLSECNIDVDAFQSGTDERSNPVYQFRLLSVKEVK